MPHPLVDDAPALSLASLRRELRGSGRTVRHGEPVIVQMARGAGTLRVGRAEFALVGVAQPFGDWRYMIVCTCGRRARVLYRPVGASAWACRSCHALVYRTTRLSDAPRLMVRAQKFADRAYRSDALWPLQTDVDGRPRGMHRRTFARFDAQRVSYLERAAATALSLPSVRRQVERRGR